MIPATLTLPSASGWALAALRWGCVAMFLGRAWQHLFWSPPYRAILMSQGLMEGVVAQMIGMDWNRYATSPQVEGAITAGIRVLGGLYLLFALAAALAGPRLRWTRIALWVSSGFLIVLALATARDRMLRVGEFFEFACQFAAPVALAWVARFDGGRSPADGAARAVPGAILRVAVAVTFGAHGLYAIGYYPMPVEWMTMVTNLVTPSEEIAVALLRVAGVLDFAVAVFVFLPGADRWAFAYAALWGGLTALARPIGMVPRDSLFEGLAYWLPELLVRLPHFFVPAALLLVLLSRREPALPQPFRAEANPQT